MFFTLFFYELNLRTRYLVQDHCTPLTKHFHSSFLSNNQKLINVIFVSFSRLIDQNVVSKSECSNQSSNISSKLISTHCCKSDTLGSEGQSQMRKRFKIKRFGLNGLRQVNGVRPIRTNIKSSCKRGH